MPRLSPEPRKLLAVDPGDTTGWAVIEDPYGSKPSLAACGELRTFDAGVLDQHGPWLAVVVESVPRTGVTDSQRRAYEWAVEQAKSHQAKLFLISPGQWKPWARAVLGYPRLKIPSLDAPSSHVKDAYCMARYILLLHYRDPLGVSP